MILVMATDTKSDDWPTELCDPLFMLDTRAGEIASIFAKRAEIFAASAAKANLQRYASAGTSAVIPVQGSLVNWGDIDLARYGATSYGWLSEALHAAVADVAVERIVLAINSPGGMVEGSDSVVDALRVARAAKPLVAHVDGLGASAGYLIAAQADEIIATHLSRLGSIGVFTGHIDVSKMMERLGVKVSLVAAGAHKVDANPYEALPDNVRAEMQAEVEDLRLGLARDIAFGRGDRLTAEAALKTEARMYRGRVNSSGRSEAIDHGLADRIGSLRDLLASSSRSHFPNTRKDKSMSTDTVTRAEHDAAVAAARSEGANAERARIASVMALEETKGREASALGLALAAGITADTAKSILAGLPKAAVETLPSGRSKDAPGGLAVVDSASFAEGTQGPSTDFERGRAAAKRFSNVQP
jgi:signal peptide peptidase SppA